jgi:hypothetical protein
MNLAVGDPAINRVGLEFPFTSLTLLQFCILTFVVMIDNSTNIKQFYQYQ